MRYVKSLVWMFLLFLGVYLPSFLLIGVLRPSGPGTIVLIIVASFLVAACSCTVIPVAGGLYYAGAGIGVAFIVLWVAPAANILALTYTASILGTKIVISRIVAALSMGFFVGFIMSAIFRKERPQIAVAKVENENRKKIIERKYFILLVLLILTLLLPNYLVIKGPYSYKVFVWVVMVFISAIYF